MNSQQLNVFSLHYFRILPSFTESQRRFTELMLKLHVVLLKYHVPSLNIHQIYFAEEQVKPSRSVSLSQFYRSVSVKI